MGVTLARAKYSFLATPVLEIHIALLVTTLPRCTHTQTHVHTYYRDISHMYSSIFDEAQDS